MRILELYSSFLPIRGGVQRHIYDLSVGLAERGDKAIVLSWAPSVSRLTALDGISHKQIHVPRIFRVLRYPLVLYLSLVIVSLVKKHKIDIIHAHDYQPGLSAALAGVLSRTPTVVTFHLPIQYTTYVPPPYLSPLILLERVLSKCFDIWVQNIICVSKFTYDETLKLGFSKDKLKIIYNWVDPLPESAVPKGILRELGMSDSHFILSVGRLFEKQKPFSLLICAFSQILIKKPDLELVIVGSGPDKKLCQTYASLLNVDDQVYFMSDLTEKELAALFISCELFVLPSFLEGLPLTILEAMAYGKPIVSTRVGGIPEVVMDDYNGALVDPNPRSLYLGLKKLLLNSQVKDAFGKRSKEIAREKFSHRNCDATIVLLESVVRSSQNQRK